MANRRRAIFYSLIKKTKCDVVQ